MLRARWLGILLVFTPAVHAAPVGLDPLDSASGYVARLLINEVPFPGERGWVSEADSKAGMRQILLVLAARLNHVPPPYTQAQIAAVESSSVLDVITAGGEHGQVDGFYRDRDGRPTVVPRVAERLDYILLVANQGTPGRFARLVLHASELARRFDRGEDIDPDFFRDLRQIAGTPVTGRAYSWMTDAGMFHPGGRFVRIPDSLHGSNGGNRFFTLQNLRP